MGRTKDAAFAMKAHIKRQGSGFSTFADLTAAATAGVRTTAVASFDKNVVTTIPTA